MGERRWRDTATNKTDLPNTSYLSLTYTKTNKLKVMKRISKIFMVVMALAFANIGKAQMKEKQLSGRYLSHLKTSL
jgi:hypothetical protein